MSCARGTIRNATSALQLRDYSGLCWDRITPTDIDGLIDFGGRAFVLFEGAGDRTRGRRDRERRCLRDRTRGRARHRGRRCNRRCRCHRRSDPLAAILARA